MRLGLVLAGGLGRRFGRPKGGVAWKGHTLAQRAARTLEPLCDGVLISLRSGMSHPAPAWRAVIDCPPAGRGPLAGLEAAFAMKPTPDELLVLACDYPGVDAELLRQLIERAAVTDDVICVVAPTGRCHPLVGLWRSSAASVIVAALEGGEYAVHAALDRLNVRLVEPVGSCDQVDGWLRNINAPSDWPG
jgi:molybdopterin-guanine dinucleotide biosynthesis protein A